MLGVLISPQVKEYTYIPSTKRALQYRANRVLETSGFIKICAGCGSKYHIHVHHKDRNPSNNAQSNLVYLCKDCHKKVHHQDNRLRFDC